jgi:hypothetical protein
VPYLFLVTGVHVQYLVLPLDGSGLALDRASMELLAIALILTLSIGLCALSARFTLETVFSLMMRSPARRTARATE